MPDAPKTIGPYQIERELGRGGMGVVFLARDTRLDRPVAIKVLPEHLAGDSDRLARFEREAKALASLHHSNIAAIYGLETHEGHHHLVLEFVEGETLADRLKRGPVPVEDALALARQIASALEAAHEKGVVHRDIKPGNVIVSADGVAKVLDFGLARTAEGSPPTSMPGSTHAPTMTSPALHHSPTIPGAIMGTAGYMSPEQARGKPVDKRSDIFSFGCVLFEMLTGRMPFAGETATDAIGALLHREPEWNLLPPTTPPRIRELLTDCLAKDRHARLHDIADARLALERALAGHEWASVSAPVMHAPGTSSRVPVVIACIAAIAMGIAGWAIANAARPAPPQPQRVHLTIPSRTAEYFRAGGAKISPDGTMIAFGAYSTETGRRCLWVRPLDSTKATPLRETDGADSPDWSWDSKSLVFHTDERIWVIDVAQGGARRLLAIAQNSAHVAWGSKDEIVLSTMLEEPGLHTVSASGGTPELLIRANVSAAERMLMFPTFLPDGERFIFLGVNFVPDQEIRTGTLFAGRLGSSEREPIADMLSVAWIVDSGWLVFVEDGVIKAVPFDLDSLRITGDAITIADGAYYFKPVGFTTLTVSRNGTIVFEPPQGGEQLVWFDAEGRRLGTVGSTGQYNSFRLSPDGSRVAAGVADLRTSGSDLWIFGTNRATKTRLTTDARWEGAPVWSRDGRTIYYSWDRVSEPEIYAIPADGSAPPSSIYGPNVSGKVWFASDASPDGQSIALFGQVDALRTEIRVLPTDGASPAAPFRSSPAGQWGARFSPDGDHIAYVDDGSGAREVYIAPYPDAGARVQVSDGGGFGPVWSPAGDRLYYIRSSDAGAASGTSAIMVVDLSGPNAMTAPPLPKILFETADLIATFDVTPDGDRFLVQLAPVDTPPIHVILNGLPERNGKRAD